MLHDTCVIISAGDLPAVTYPTGDDMGQPADEVQEVVFKADVEHRSRRQGEKSRRRQETEA